MNFNKAISSVAFLISLFILSSPSFAGPPMPAIKVGDAAGGDLTGTYPNPSIKSGLLKYCRIEAAQESNFDEEIDVATGTSLSVLTLPITVAGTQTIKFDAMMRVKFVTNDTDTSYRYIIQYSLHKDGVFIASGNEIGEDNNTDGSSRDMITGLHLSWVDEPTAGDHVYELQVHIPTTNVSDIKQAWVVGARSLNAMVCDN